LKVVAAGLLSPADGGRAGSQTTKQREPHIMPQDNPRTANQRAENARSENSRSERDERTTAANTGNAQFADMNARNLKAGLRMQKELFDTLQDIGRGWFSRATSEAELAFKLPNRLTSAGSVPDALTAYREWLNEWLSMCGEDGRNFISDSQKIMDTSARCFAAVRPDLTSR
jgi:hypothetical protein